MSTTMQAIREENNGVSTRPTLDFASRFSGYVLGPPISLRAESKTSHDVDSDEVHERASRTTCELAVMFNGKSQADAALALTWSPQDSTDWDSDERRSSTSSDSGEPKLFPSRPQIISASSFPLPPDARPLPSLSNTSLHPASSDPNSTPSTPSVPFQRVSTPSSSTQSSPSPRYLGQATASTTTMHTPSASRPLHSRTSPHSLSSSSRSTSSASPRLDPLLRQSDHHRFAQSVSMTPIPSPSSPVDTSHSDRHGPSINTALRSAPGVVGLGEGWAGGPQRKKAKRKWATRGDKVEADPLVLPAVDEGNEVGASRSPLKAIWDHSVLLLFGGSQTGPSESQGEVKEEASLGEKLKGMFSRSRLNLSSFSPGDVPPSKTSKELFSSSQPDLLGSPSSPPPAQHHNAGQRPPFPRDSVARSGPHLGATPPRRPDSLKGQNLSPTSRGRASPWRPVSSMGGMRSQTPSIPEVDEPPASSSSVSLETPLTDDNPPALLRVAQPNTSPGRILMNDFSRAQRSSDAEEPGMDTLRAWAEEAGDSRIKSPTPASSKRKQSIFSWQRGTTSPPEYPAKGNPHARSMPILSTIPSPTPAAREPALRVPMSNPTYAFTPDLNYEAPSPPSPIRSTPINRPPDVRGSSWIALSGDTWRKRLSRLSEDDEEQGHHRQSLLDRVRAPSFRTPSSRSRNDSHRPDRLSASASAPTLSELLHPHLESVVIDREVEDTLNINRWSSTIASLDLHPSEVRHRPAFTRGVSGRLDETARDNHANENRSRRYQDPDPVDTTRGIALDLQPPISQACTTNPIIPDQPRLPIISDIDNSNEPAETASSPARNLLSSFSSPSARPSSGLTDFTKVVGSNSLSSTNGNEKTSENLLHP